MGKYFKNKQKAYGNSSKFPISSNESYDLCHFFVNTLFGVFIAFARYGIFVRLKLLFS